MVEKGGARAGGGSGCFLVVGNRSHHLLLWLVVLVDTPPWMLELCPPSSQISVLHQLLLPQQCLQPRLRLRRCRVHLALSRRLHQLHQRAHQQPQGPGTRRQLRTNTVCLRLSRPGWTNSGFFVSSCWCSCTLGACVCPGARAKLDQDRVPTAAHTCSSPPSWSSPWQL